MKPTRLRLTFHRGPLREDGHGALGHPFLPHHRGDLGAPTVRANPQEVTRLVVPLGRIQDTPMGIETERPASERREKVLGRLVREEHILFFHDTKSSEPLLPPETPNQAHYVQKSSTRDNKMLLLQGYPDIKIKATISSTIGNF